MTKEKSPYYEPRIRDRSVKDIKIHNAQLEQSQNIRAKLGRGTTFTKINIAPPDSAPIYEKIETPLSEKQRYTLLWNLRVLEYREIFGNSTVLPYFLRYTNPNTSKWLVTSEMIDALIDTRNIH